MESNRSEQLLDHSPPPDPITAISSIQSLQQSTLNHRPVPDRSRVSFSVPEQHPESRHDIDSYYPTLATGHTYPSSIRYDTHEPQTANLEGRFSNLQLSPVRTGRELSNSLFVTPKFFDISR